MPSSAVSGITRLNPDILETFADFDVFTSNMTISTDFLVRHGFGHESKIETDCNYRKKLAK